MRTPRRQTRSQPPSEVRLLLEMLLRNMKEEQPTPPHVKPTGSTK
jgi:hypothetical protein